MSNETPEYDFREAIHSISRKARRSRMRVNMIGVILVSSILVFAYAVYFSQVRNEYRFDYQTIGFSMAERLTNPSIEADLTRRVSFLVAELIGSDKVRKSIDDDDDESFVPPSKEEAAILEGKLSKALQDLELGIRIFEEDNVPRDESSAIVTAIASSVFSLGAVAFIIMLIQISVMFMRYHTRLAEFYDAQVDALKACGGDADRAIKFMEVFSPNSIEMGRTPTTLYEKALDTVKEVASKTK